MKKNYFQTAGTIAIALLFFFLSGNAHADLYINEFMASNDAAYPGPQGDFPDWIEIYNTGTTSVNLGGYYLSDDLTDPLARYQIPSTYPDSVTVAAGGFLVFYANGNESSSVLNLNFKLNGSGEAIGFWDPQEAVEDSLTFGEQIADISYGRFPDGTNTWYFMEEFTPGGSNIYTPGTLSELYINEFMASNDTAFPGPQGDYPDWIEIYNAGTEDVMLGGYFLSDDLIYAETRYQIPSTYPDSVTVTAGGFIVFYANGNQGSSVLNLNFKLNGDGEAIGLWNPQQVIIDSLTFGLQSTDSSYGRFPDGSNMWYIMDNYTPGAPNQHSTGIGEDEINTVMVRNYPNPFSHETSIVFTLENTDIVTITIFDVTGAVIEVLTESHFSAGEHCMKWDATDLPAGYYFYCIETSHSRVMRKAAVVR